VCSANSEGTPKDFVVDQRSEDPLEVLLARELATLTREFLTSLTPREERVLRLRFGIEGSPELTLEEVGAVFGVSRERIRQIQTKALDKIRSQRGAELRQLLQS
jgi:RNA polymerase primary sigma factor